MSKLTPFQQQMRNSIVQWNLFQAGMGALQQLSGIDPDEALAAINVITTDEQRKKILSAVETMQQFNLLTPEQQAKVLGSSQEEMIDTPNKRDTIEEHKDDYHGKTDQG